MSDMETVFKALLETEEDSFEELGKAFSALDELLPIFGSLGLPSILQALLEFKPPYGKFYDDEELAILREAKDKIEALDDYRRKNRPRSTPPQ